MRPLSKSDTSLTLAIADVSKVLGNIWQIDSGTFGNRPGNIWQIGPGIFGNRGVGSAAKLRSVNVPASTRNLAGFVGLGDGEFRLPSGRYRDSCYSAKVFDFRQRAPKAV
jgi:hypothetical protein